VPLLPLHVYGVVFNNDSMYVQLLAKLLPALVQKLATAQPKTRAKVGHSQHHLPGVWCMQQAACSPCTQFNSVVGHSIFI
jgi:hypothetical protein